MPGVFRYSLDKINLVIDKALKKGVPMVALFPYTENKQTCMSGAYQPIGATSVRRTSSGEHRLADATHALTRNTRPSRRHSSRPSTFPRQQRAQ